MQGFTCNPVHHFYSERRRRIPVIRFFHEKAQGLFQVGIETFLCREVAFIAGNTRPEQRRNIDRVMPRLTLHRRKLRPDIRLNAFQLLRIVRPRQDITMTPHGRKTPAMSLVQKLIEPFLVDLIGAAIPRERLQVPGTFLELLECFGRVVQKNVE